MSMGKRPREKEICMLHKNRSKGSSNLPSCKRAGRMVNYSHEEKTPKKRNFQRKKLQDSPKRMKKKFQRKFRNIRMIL